jgi:hypothetical protein
VAEYVDEMGDRAARFREHAVRFGEHVARSRITPT